MSYFVLGGLVCFGLAFLLVCYGSKYFSEKVTLKGVASAVLSRQKHGLCVIALSLYSCGIPSAILPFLLSIL